jgi:hypothetical protein
MARYARVEGNLLAMALVGYESEKARIEAAIAEIRAQLGQRGPGRPKAASVTTEPTGPKRRTLSASARKRIAAAQRKRWAALKKGKAETPKPKRKLSAAGRRAIVEATKKRWAAFHKAQKSGPKPKSGETAA